MPWGLALRGDGEERRRQPLGVRLRGLAGWRGRRWEGHLEGGRRWVTWEGVQDVSCQEQPLTRLFSDMGD